MNEQEEKAVFDEYLSLWPLMLRRTCSMEQAERMGEILDRVEADRAAAERLRTYVEVNLARVMFGSASREEIAAEIFALHHALWDAIVRGERNIEDGLLEAQLLKDLARSTGVHGAVSELNRKDLLSVLAGATPS